MRASLLVLLTAWTSFCLGQNVLLHPAPPTHSRPRRAEQDFWSGRSVDFSSSFPLGQPFMEIPVNDVQLGSDGSLDKIQVVSSAIRVLPRKGKKTKRDVSERPWRTDSPRAKRETVQSWRKPRQHQFVTNKSDRLPPPPIVRVRVYPPADRNERFYDRDYRKSQRRIIYYANLPEIVRPPVQWYNTRDYYDSPRQAYPSAFPMGYSSNSFPSPSENEVTRVQSNIIDVTPSRRPGYSSTPKFTIIDVEPPYSYNNPSYNRRPSLPSPTRYDLYPFPSPQYTPNRYYNDVRTPPYRDHSHFPSQNFRPDSSLEPVKLQIPTTDSPSTPNSTELPTNTTRFLPDTIPVSLSKFVT
ncbi:uncharacterized protein LOC124365720 [Homalodisca vitripennis]|uniref:uncharacterized protein LOC124365720 n=1 Tax=Homalodisca vitripennis TaxID=197043 RepID=UPI001EEAC8AD|nr:uncharacterized protein LOC124365720 [Homalodisca vitripennis]